MKLIVFYYVKVLLVLHHLYVYVVQRLYLNPNALLVELDYHPLKLMLKYYDGLYVVVRLLLHLLIVY